MSRLIQNLQIKNFKSIRDLSLDCDRINIFIGKPNAGKSNILEAISLLGAGYSGERFMEGFIRYNSLVHLFHNFKIETPVEINANSYWAKLLHLGNSDLFEFSIKPFQNSHEIFIKKNNKKHQFDHFQTCNFSLYLDGRFHKRKEDAHRFSPVKKYEFKSIGDYQEKALFLFPPFGSNFYLIARTQESLREEIYQFMKPNGLEFLFDEGTNRVAVVHRESRSLVSFPMLLVPDTFQRYIFHLAAILSNQNSVLLFEEPETHSYPPYVYQLAQHILQDDRNNQYFLTTHNPYLLTPILEETKDVALFITWFEDYQTHARRLTPDEIGEVLNDGLDVFLNLNHFVPVHE